MPESLTPPNKTVQCSSVSIFHKVWFTKVYFQPQAIFTIDKLYSALQEISRHDRFIKSVSFSFLVLQNLWNVAGKRFILGLSSLRFHGQSRLHRNVHFISCILFVQLWEPWAAVGLHQHISYKSWAMFQNCSLHDKSA